MLLSEFILHQSTANATFNTPCEQAIRGLSADKAGSVVRKLGYKTLWV